MTERSSALLGQVQQGRFGTDGLCGVHMSEITDLQLHQVAAWPDTINTVGELSAIAVGLTGLVAPARTLGDANRAVLRIEPLKFWLLGAEPASLEPDQGATLDLSHSRVRIRLHGRGTVTLLNRLLPLDLREQSFPPGSVATSAMHHVSVTLWRNELGYELFIPRGFAVSVWQVLFESALQFGVEIS